MSTQALFDLKDAIVRLTERTDRLIADRKEDRSETKASLEKFEGKLDKLRDDVVKLKISWAKIIGMGAAAGTVAAFIAELAKEHIHFG